jgi:general secretion pathway protein D
MTMIRHRGLCRLLLASVLTLPGIYAAYAQEEGEVPENPPPALTEAPQPAPAAPTAPVTPAAPKAPAAVTATAPPGCNPTGTQVCINFQAADAQAVVKVISQMTRRNFLLDPRMKGQQITIISAKPVSRESAYEIFLSAIKAQGFTAVEGNGIVKIIPAGDAKLSAEIRDEPGNSEQVITHVAILQHVSAQQLVPLLRPLMAPTSHLSSYDGANALILTDYADNIRRMLRIIERIDAPVSSDVTVIPVKHASALDLGELISRLASPPGFAQGSPGVPMGMPTGERFTIVADLRTNSLLVRTDSPGRLSQLRSLIEKLDVPATTNGQTRVIYLRNAEAAKLAEVLRGLLAGESRAAGTGNVPQQGQVVAPGGARTGNRPGEASLIQADESTNALIINAPDAVYNNLRAVIEKLDVRRAQVFVEGLIAEITTDDATELGFQWADAGPAGKGAIVGVSNHPSSTQQGLVSGFVNPATALSGPGLTLAFLGPKITLPDGSSVHTLGALARALESKSLANILSTPNLLTLDNAEASIHVGQNVPFITGSFTGGTTGGTNPNVNPFQTVERQDIGLKLKIKPQISEGGTVRLDISQETSSVSNAAASFGAADIITNKRTIETKVLVDDGSTVVLGGLIEESANDKRTQIPLLGRIPLLGALFRSKETGKKKTNLMVFLRPTILRTVDDSFRMTTDRYDYIRAIDKQQNKDRDVLLDRLKPMKPVPKPEKESFREEVLEKGDVTENKHVPKKETPAKETPPATDDPKSDVKVVPPPDAATPTE